MYSEIVCLYMQMRHYLAKNQIQIHFIVISLRICIHKIKQNIVSASSNVCQCF